MRCQRCGFEIEPGQTFCSMCGTEQSKAIRADKKKKITSIFGIIKVTSNNHLKMYVNLFLSILSFILMYFTGKDEPVFVTYICLWILLFSYIFFQCLVPYKNPNASKSKKYKLGVRISFILVVILSLIIFLGDFSLMEFVRDM